MSRDDGEPGAPAKLATLGDPPPGDARVRAVAQARIAQRLFAIDERVRLGRYQLLEIVGAGGMGVVWGAWDPELDRRVAIKLVAAAGGSARERILIEGQALARLSHPNVVPVYDVGVVDDDVYLVMEWVRGKNLRAYCREPRDVGDLVAIYRQAGQGLAAAHAAGLVHRDFKPDNAIRGDDGRVRVLDFGLVRADVAAAAADGDREATRGAGTPRYMAPEQIAGAAVTPAVDQYAFCVSLREALAGRLGEGRTAALPRWLDEIVTRGTAADATARFASMAALVHALGRDPARVRRRRVLAVLAVTAAAVAFVIGSLRAGAGEPARCVGGTRALAASWNLGTRVRLGAHLQSLGAYAAGELPRIGDALDGYGTAWAAAHDRACLAHERGELTPQLYEHQLGCLQRARVALEAIAAVLSTAPAQRLGDAMIAAHGLPDPDGCATETTTSRVAPPARAIAHAAGQLADEIERARVLAAAVDPSAIAAAAATVATADQLGYAPLIARANLAHGLALTRARRRDQAVAPLARAVDAALDADDDATFVEAYAREVYAFGVTDQRLLDPALRKPLDLLPYVERVAKRAGAAGALGRARLYNDVGTAHLAANDRPGARIWFDRAVGEANALAPSVDLADLPGNLAQVIDRPDERDRLLAQQIAEYEATVGPDHARTLQSKLAAAMFIADPVVAADRLRTSCRRLQALHPELRGTLETYRFELGWLAEERGDRDEARAAFSEIDQPDEARRVAAGYLQLLAGQLEPAARAMMIVGADLEHADWWIRVTASDAFLVAGEGWLRLGRDRDAAAALSRGLALLEPIEMPAYQRRRARTQGLLAHAIARSDPDRAHKLAELALRWYRAAGHYDAVVAELQAIKDSR